MRLLVLSIVLVVLQTACADYLQVGCLDLCVVDAMMSTVAVFTDYARTELEDAQCSHLILLFSHFLVSSSF